MTILSAVLYYVVTIFESLCLGELLGTFLAFFGMLMYNLVKKEREHIKPTIKIYIWTLKHPIKTINLIKDMLVTDCMSLDDKVSNMILKRKYKSNKRRLKRIQYEDESEKEWMEGTMKSFGDVLQHTSKCLDIGPSFMYAPRRVVYKDFDQYWKMIL